MTVHHYCMIGGTDFGPEGENKLFDITLNVAGKGKVGDGTIVLKYLESAPYVITAGMKVLVYKTGTAGFGWLGGIVINKTYKVTKRKAGLENYLTVTVDVADLNIALDVVINGAAPGVQYNASADTLANQVAALFQVLQWNGHGSVAWQIDAGTYVSNLTGATVLPAYSLSGESLRDGMDKIMANAFLQNSALRPGYHIALMSDGLGGVEPALLVYDKANVATSKFTIASNANVGAGEYAIYEIEDQINGVKLTQYRQVRWGNPLISVITYQNSTSQGLYPNVFQNDGGAGATGYFKTKPMLDQDSQSSAQATAKLQAAVTPVEFPIQTLTLTVDNIDIVPGDVATIRIPETGVNSNFVCVQVKVKFLKKSNGLTYSRTTITFGRRKRALGDTGEDDEAAAPDDILSPPPPYKPNITNPITGGISRLGTYYASPVVNKNASGDDASGGGVIYWQATAGAPTTAPIHSQPIPAGSTFPFTGFANNLATGVTYSFWAVIINKYGEMSEASDTVTYTPVRPPSTKPPVNDWSAAHPDALLDGFTLTAPSGTNVSIDTSDTYVGRASMVMEVD